MSRREIIGLIILVVGIVLAIYVGIWLMMVGDIIDLIEIIKAPVTQVDLVVTSVFRIIVAGIITWFSILASIYLADIVASH